MNVLVTFALENEFAPWRKLRGFQRMCVDPWDYTYLAKVGAVDVRVVLTGAGRFAAQRAMEKSFCDVFGVVPDLCICAGLTGALKAAYHAGEVLVAQMVGDTQGTRWIWGDPGLLASAAASGATRVEKFIVSS